MAEPTIFVGLSNLKDANKKISVARNGSEVVGEEIEGSPSHSTPGISQEAQVFPLAQSQKIKWMERTQFAVLCFCLFLAGYNDGIGSTGPLLLVIQRHYDVNFAVVSLLFVCSGIGCITAGLLNVYLTDKFGFGKTIVFGALWPIVSYAVMAAAPPFPLFVIGSALNGFGLALQDAQSNGFVAALKPTSTTKMNIIHAIYGLGALISPLIATQFSSMTHWSFHYFTCLFLAIVNLGLLFVIFKLQTQDAIMTQNGQAPAEVGTSQQSTMRQIISTKAVHLLAFFILVYVGIEVTIGGWIVTFVVQKRGGNPANAGYISTGFWGGLTMGRLVLHYANRMIPQRHTIFLYALLCIGLELTVWLIPSLIGNAVSVSMIGFLLGPFYPLVMSQASIILPRWLLTGSIGWIAGFGQSGSAAIPFMTGALANKFGISSLQPLMISMMVLMIILWAFVPKQRRID